MSLARQLNHRTTSNILGIDCSTNSVAYAKMNDGKLVTYGEIPFIGADVYERLAYAHGQIMDWIYDFKDTNYLAIEKTITVRSPATAVKMGYMAGVVMGTFLSETNAHVKEVAPISWQNAIGNPRFTALEKKELYKQYPGHKASWYQNKIRQTRKQRTIDWAYKTFGVTIDSDNISDAIGLAWYASQ